MVLRWAASLLTVHGGASGWRTVLLGRKPGCGRTGAAGQRQRQTGLGRSDGGVAEDRADPDVEGSASYGAGPCGLVVGLAPLRVAKRVRTLDTPVQRNLRRGRIAAHPRLSRIYGLPA